jgi:glycosyltransferase involved in cell wall biosynthesis
MKYNKIHVTIILSTYNGENFLVAQLNSLLEQNYDNFNVIIRDDGSTDATASIIESYCNRYKEIFKFKRDSLGNVGVQHSFLSLLPLVSYDSYLMFCDQDDIWFKNKVTLFIESILESEATYKDIPIIVFGDMIVVDEDTCIINQSFWNYQSLNFIDERNWVSILATNIVTGCSSLLNPYAVALLRPNNLLNLPLLHDHLAAILTTKSGGRIIRLESPTMFYRQHGNNAVGASKFNYKYAYKKIKNISNLIYKYETINHFFEINSAKFYFYKIFNNLKRLFF